jgi:hypothetical protein
MEGLMLTPLDDSLWHQIASPFENVGTSDHRFFDRMWFATYDPAGSGALQFTVGVYNNMNVIDGGFVVIRDTTQFNLRESRSLRPRFEPIVDAMRIDVVEPFEHIRLVVEPGDHHVHGELHWRAVLPPELEKPHVARIRGRLNEDYQRLDRSASSTASCSCAAIVGRSIGGGRAVTTRGECARASADGIRSPAPRHRCRKWARCSPSSSSRPTSTRVTCR